MFTIVFFKVEILENPALNVTLNSTVLNDKFTEAHATNAYRNS